MVDESKPLRVWPAVALASVYWAEQLVVSQSDMGMFPRFLSGALGALAFLLLFLILWLSTGGLSWRTRLAGLGTFVAGLIAAILLAHKSYEPVGFMMASVPYVLTSWTAWMLLRRRLPAVPDWSLALGLLLSVGVFDLIRWEGLDGRLKSTVSWRWSPTAEQTFLASMPAAADARPAKPWILRDGDWPEFRGPLRDGVVRGVRISPDWKASPPEKLWRRAVGPGWSSVILVDGNLVTQEQRGESEAVVCYEAETGKELWAHLEPGRFSEGIAGAGPRATPTYRDGRLYAYGASGRLVCLEAAGGKKLWSRDVGSGESVPLPQWGFSSSPLLVDGRVVVYGGVPRGVVALDAATGAPVWVRESGKDSYSSAHVLTLQGRAQVLMQDNLRTVGLAASDGALLWERPNPNPAAPPMIQPHPQPGGGLLVSSSQDLALVELREEGPAWKVAEKWQTAKFRPSFNDFVVHEGHAYGFDDGTLACVNLKDGTRVWRKGRYGAGQLLLIADQGLLLVLSEKGELALVDASPQEPGEVPRFPALDGKTWNHPVLAGDRLYLRNAAELACYRLKAFKGS